MEMGTRSDQELVGKKKSKVKRFLVYGVIAAILITIIVLLAVFLTRGDDSNNDALDGPSISLEDVLEGRYSAKGYSVEWVSDTEVLLRNGTSGELLLHNVVTDEKQTLMTQQDGELANGVTFSLSPDRKFLLISTNYIRLFRNSFHAIYYTFDLTTREGTPVFLDTEGRPSHLLLAKWNPTTNGIVFSFNSDLYYKPTPSDKVIRLTQDGKPGVFTGISNGVPDWVYEEEVLASNSALWFSPDGTKLSYIRFDDSGVRDMALPLYGVPGDLNWQYTRSRFINYPKPGTPNPTVQLNFIDLTTLNPEATQTIQTVNPPAQIATLEHIISTVAWANEKRMISVWMNRIQNFAIIYGCDFREGTAQPSCTTLTELESKSWVDLFTQPLFNTAGDQMVIISSQSEGEAGAFRHITLIADSGTSIKALTSGKYVVAEILKWHQPSNHIFYTANLPDDAGAKHLYAVKAEVGSTPVCITCNRGDGQSYYEIDFSTEGGTFIVSSKGPNIPQDFLYTWSGNATTGFRATQLKMLEDNVELTNSLKTVSVPLVEFHEIPLDNGFTARVKLNLPRRIDRSGRRKYPMLVDVYAGPDSFGTDNKFKIDWGSHLASNKSYIYARIDGRGSGMRGDKLLNEIYGKLGTVEIEDQIITAKKLADKLPYIDREHIGIWGWSYGGYASAFALVQDQGDDKIFKCATSVAPVTDWLLYDTIYTERYMKLPADNKEAYENSRLSTRYKEFIGRKYMMIHGTLDDNVHFQQAMALARTLEKNDVQFKQVAYPDEDHSLAGVRPHLYHTLSNFFDECFTETSAS